MRKLAAVLLSFAVLGCDQYSNGLRDNANQGHLMGGEEVRRNSKSVARKSVVILRSDKGLGPGHHCTGVLVGRQTVLTAAHCIEMFLKDAPKGVSKFPDDKKISVFFGLNIRLDKTAASRAAKQFILHPQYQSNPIPYDHTFSDGELLAVTVDRRFDLALFNFEGEAPSDYQPAIVFSGDEDLSGTVLSVYGAGARGNFEDVKSNAEALNILPGVLKRGRFVIQPGYANVVDFYTIEGQNGARICGGDSGGPAFLLDAPVPTLVGLNASSLSRKHKPQACGDDSMSTKLAPFATWIEQQIKLLE